MQLQRVRRGKRRQRKRRGIKSHAVHVVHRRHGMHFINDLLRVRFAPGLQIRIDEKIHGMELMPLAAHVHGRFLLRGVN